MKSVETAMEVVGGATTSGLFLLKVSIWLDVVRKITFFMFDNTFFFILWTHPCCPTPLFL